MHWTNRIVQVQCSTNFLDMKTPTKTTDNGLPVSLTKNCSSLEDVTCEDYQRPHGAGR